MLLFITEEQLKKYVTTVFQYISCYCLSSHSPACVLSLICFNTSHVTVYRFPFQEKSAWIQGFNTSHVTVYRRNHVFLISHFWFQYISCYCLSCHPYRSCERGSKFQYISCYCLSLVSGDSYSANIRFNTSHVTVYPDYRQNYI